MQQALENIARCIEAGRLAEAERLCLLALKAAPNDIPLRQALGVVWVQQGRFADAVNCFDEILASKSDSASTYLNRANALKTMGRAAEALESINQALSLKPDYPAALSNRAALLIEMGRVENALTDYETILALQPGNIGALIGQGNVLRKMAETKADAERAALIEKAVERYQAAIRRTPESADAHYSLAITLHRLDRLSEAIEHYQHAVRLKPALAEALSDLGVAQFEAGRFREAVENLDLALAREPGRPNFLWNKSLYLLATGNFADGWPLYESRLPDQHRHPRRLGWLDSENLEAKTIHVWAEQGLGDTIQFCRYVPLLRAKGAKVIFHVQKRMVRLLSSLGTEISVVSSSPRSKQADYTIPLLSLPLAFGTNLESVPASVPYLHADTEKRRMWKARLDTHGFKIGVTWQGTMGSKLAAARSFPRACLKRLGQLPGVRLISLQKNAQPSSFALDGIALEGLGPEFDAGDDAFVDAAAVIQNLDLVISADTAIAHLAGALGCRTWVALKQVPDWRWLLDREDSPWYPTMTLFRQPQRGDWESVFLVMERELEKICTEVRA